MLDTLEGNCPIQKEQIVASITFERFERDCDYNKDLRRDGGESARGIIYDFKVMIYGEHRCTIKRRYSGSKGYNVEIASSRHYHGPIKVDRYVYVIKSQSVFEREINWLMSKDAIPTTQQIEEMDAEIDRKAAKRKADQDEADRIERIKEAGLELYAAAKALLEGGDVGKIEALRRAVFKAEGGAA